MTLVLLLTVPMTAFVAAVILRPHNVRQLVIDALLIGVLAFLAGLCLGIVIVLDVVAFSGVGSLCTLNLNDFHLAFVLSVLFADVMTAVPFGDLRSRSTGVLLFISKAVGMMLWVVAILAPGFIGASICWLLVPVGLLDLIGACSG
jgi:hypothetical protein